MALTDPRIGVSRKVSCEIGNWGMTTQRAKEAAGILPTYTDGASVNVLLVPLCLHVLDLIAESNPISGPSRKARTPKKSFQKGYRRARTPAELEAARSVEVHARGQPRYPGQRGRDLSQEPWHRVDRRRGAPLEVSSGALALAHPNQMASDDRWRQGRIRYNESCSGAEPRRHQLRRP
jgi:hypothetical protein